MRTANGGATLSPLACRRAHCRKGAFRIVLELFFHRVEEMFHRMEEMFHSMEEIFQGAGRKEFGRGG